MKEQDKQVQQLQNPTDENNAPLHDEELGNVSGGDSGTSTSKKVTYKFNKGETVGIGTLDNKGLVRDRKTDSTEGNLYLVQVLAYASGRISGWYEEGILKKI